MCFTHFLSNKFYVLFNIFMVFGKNFKKLRLEVGLSQQEVAKKLEICQSNISDWENDISRPEYENLIQISKIYGVSLYELLSIDENF